MRKVVQNSNVQPLMLKALDYDDNSQDVFFIAKHASYMLENK